MRAAPPLALHLASLGALLPLVLAVVGVPSARSEMGCYCGQPLSGIPDTAPDHPLATDCLFILNVGIGLQTCDPVCICDVDASGDTPNATDALICLKAAVGVSDLLACECPEPPCKPTAACSEMEFRLLAGSELDVGWTGDGHDSPLAEDASLFLRVIRRCHANGAVCQVDADCSGGDLCEPTCACDDNDTAPCEVTGPIGSQKRCYRETNVTCQSDVDCQAPQTCETFLWPPVPLTVNGTPLCVTTYLDEDVTGLIDPSLGTVEFSARVRYRVNLGISQLLPCPRCGPPSETPAVGESFLCEGSAQDGHPCTVGAVNSLFGGTSLDCPPALQLETGFE